MVIAAAVEGVLGVAAEGKPSELAGTTTFPAYTLRMANRRQGSRQLVRSPPV